MPLCPCPPCVRTLPPILLLASLPLASCSDSSGESADADKGSDAVECPEPVGGTYRLVDTGEPGCMPPIGVAQVELGDGDSVLLQTDVFTATLRPIERDGDCSYRGLACAAFEGGSYEEFELALDEEARELTIDYASTRTCVETVSYALEAVDEVCTIEGDYFLTAPFLPSEPQQGACSMLLWDDRIEIGTGPAPEVEWTLPLEAVVDPSSCTATASYAGLWGPDFETVGTREMTIEIESQLSQLSVSVSDDWRPGEAPRCTATGTFEARRYRQTSDGSALLEEYQAHSGEACASIRPAICGDGVCEGDENCGQCETDCACDGHCSGNQCLAACDPFSEMPCDEGQRCLKPYDEAEQPVCYADPGATAKLGESCFDSNDCASGLECDESAGSLGVCAPRCDPQDPATCDTQCVAVGDFGACKIACQASELGTCPSPQAICRREFGGTAEYCEFRPDGLLPGGASCSGTSQCDEGLACRSVNGGAYTCMPL